MPIWQYIEETWPFRFRRKYGKRKWAHTATKPPTQATPRVSELYHDGMYVTEVERLFSTTLSWPSSTWKLSNVLKILQNPASSKVSDPPSEVRIWANFKWSTCIQLLDGADRAIEASPSTSFMFIPSCSRLRTRGVTWIESFVAAWAHFRFIYLPSEPVLRLRSTVWKVHII